VHVTVVLELDYSVNRVPETPLALVSKMFSFPEVLLILAGHFAIRVQWSS
jgi:hypothetical protein